MQQHKYKWLIAFRQPVPDWDGTTNVNVIRCEDFQICDVGKTILAKNFYGEGSREMWLNRNNILSILQIADR